MATNIIANTGLHMAWVYKIGLTGHAEKTDRIQEDQIPSAGIAVAILTATESLLVPTASFME